MGVQKRFLHRALHKILNKSTASKNMWIELIDLRNDSFFFFFFFFLMSRKTWLINATRDVTDAISSILVEKLDLVLEGKKYGI